jgi:calmodulin
MFDEAKQVFERYDLNNTGKMDLNEIGEALRSLGADPTDSELEKLSADAEDDSGSVTLRSFIEAYARNFVRKEKALWDAFLAFDKEGSGFVTKD